MRVHRALLHVASKRLELHWPLGLDDVAVCGETVDFPADRQEHADVVERHVQQLFLVDPLVPGKYTLICRLLRVYETEKDVTLVLEYCSGGDMSSMPIFFS